MKTIAAVLFTIVLISCGIETPSTDAIKDSTDSVKVIPIDSTKLIKNDTIRSK